MNRLLKKVALVSGDEELIVCSLVYTLLAEDAIVIVPAKSADSIRRLKNYVSHIQSGKLITCLTDCNDFNKIREIAAIVTARFGFIDLAVLCFVSPQASSCLLNTNMTDWEKMIEMNVTSYFVGAHILLKALNNNGLFISICNMDDFIKKDGSALANLSAMVQTEMAKIFHDEISGSGLRYHHLFINYANLDKHTSRETPGEFIVQLYEGKTNHPDSLFQSLTEESLPQKTFTL